MIVLKVIHRQMSRSVRVLWLLEELKVPYDVDTVERGVGKTEAFRMTNPLGKVPVLIDDDVAVFDSGAILEYLLEKYDAEHQFSPPRGSAQWRDYIQWMHGSETFVLPGSQFGHHTIIRSVEDRVPELAVEGKADYETNLAYLDKLLSQRMYLSGEQFTAADIMMGWSLFVMEMVGFGEDLAHVQRYSKVLKARPAYRKIGF